MHIAGFYCESVADRTVNSAVFYLQNALRRYRVALRLFNVCFMLEAFMSTRFKKAPLQYETMAQLDVPQGRNGKHKQIVSLILNDLNQLKDGSALKVPLAELAETKEKVRSALNRATRKEGRKVATATDDKYLYIWNLSR